MRARLGKSVKESAGTARKLKDMTIYSKTKGSKSTTIMSRFGSKMYALQGTDVTAGPETEVTVTSLPGAEAVTTLT